MKTDIKDSETQQNLLYRESNRKYSETMLFNSNFNVFGKNILARKIKNKK